MGLALMTQVSSSLHMTNAAVVVCLHADRRGMARAMIMQMLPHDMQQFAACS